RLFSSNTSPIHFVRHVELRAFLGQLFLEHFAYVRVLVAVLDGVAAFFDVEVQTPPVYPRNTLDSLGITAKKSQHTQGFLGCAEVTVEPAGVARRRAHDAAGLVILPLNQLALAVFPGRRPCFAGPREGVALAA